MTEHFESRNGQNRIEDELSFVLGHPSANLRPQSKKLLRYLAYTEGSKTVDQVEIAKDILGRGEEFRPDIDPHVRVAVSRLRKELARFYDQLGKLRPVRLAIPKGVYRVVLLPNEAVLDSSEGLDQRPWFAWSVTTDGTQAAKALAHRIDRAIGVRIVEAPLIHDGALRAERLPVWSSKSAFDEAHRAGAAALAQVHVVGESKEIMLAIWCPLDDPSPVKHLLGRYDDSADIDVLIQKVLECLTDPLNSALPMRLAKLYPRSRLAMAMRFFSFMATQDRQLLTGSLEALDWAIDSNISSPLIRALRIDALRANYAFATGGTSMFDSRFVEEAARVVEDDPYQPYAELSYAYAAVAAGFETLPDVLDRENVIYCSGSLEDDHRLYRTLAGFKETRNSLSDESRSQSFFSDLSDALCAIRTEEFDQAAKRVFSTRSQENFWTRVFQCSLAMDIGQEQLARKTFARLRSEIPQVEDFAGRAIVTMLPDRYVQSRVIFNLSRVS